MFSRLDRRTEDLFFRNLLIYNFDLLWDQLTNPLNYAEQGNSGFVRVTQLIPVVKYWRPDERRVVVNSPLQLNKLDGLGVYECTQATAYS